jgi:radical SAM protein with 4Fe4S-binding SPASM domain
VGIEGSLRRKLSVIGDVYRRGGLGGLLRFSASVRDYFREPAVMHSSPLFLQVEPTIHCNLECSFCINPFLPRTRTSMTADKFGQLLDQVPSTTKISLVGIGESFMNKELWAIIRRAKARGVSIGTTSNGTILTDRLLQEIVDSGLDWLNFSIDGATKATYERMRPGATFETMLANIRRVVAALHGRARPELAIWFLSTRDNIHELPAMVELVQSLGIRSLNTQGVHYWGSENWHQRANDANRVDDLLAIIVETRRRATAAGLDFKWFNFPDAHAERECKWPWKGAYITADGFVTPCCENGSDPSRINFGNIFERPFAEIWNSGEYQQFRRDLASPHRRPSICVDCPSYHKPIAVSRTLSNAGR